VGDAAGLAALMVRFARDPAFAAQLRQQCAALAPAYAPAAEAAAVRGLVMDVLG
jgi:hypothetical protein